jgi:hypothetical protein
MVNTAVEMVSCEACGAEVREGSLFCYNCGTSVTARANVETREQEASATPINDEAVRKDLPPLRSAASLRKHRRAINRQPVRVSWERPAGPAMAFIISTLVVTLGAAILVILVFYLQ